MYIQHPIKKYKIFLSNSISSYEERLELIQSKILSDSLIMKFLNENRYIRNNKQMETYYKAMELLEKCSTYLLKGQYKKNNIMTIFDIRNAVTKELPLSSVKGNANDLVYGETNCEDESGAINASTKLSSRLQLPTKKKKETNYQKYKKQKSYKINQLYKKKFKNKPIESVWCVVDTENNFLYNGQNYILDERHEGYKVNEDNSSDMERVLCFRNQHNNDLWFFDESIEDITNLIKQV